MDETWIILTPHRDGALKIDAKIEHIGKQEAIILELLASGKLVTPDQIADRIWSTKRPKLYLSLIEHRMVTIRKMLPPFYVMTVYEEGARFLDFIGLHAFSSMTGWQLTGKIHLQSEL